jgi:hypothetical protein
VADEKKNWNGFDGNPRDARIDTGNRLATEYAGELCLNARATGGLSGDRGR